MVRNSSLNYEIDYFIVMKIFLNPKLVIIGLKVKVILLKGLPIGGVTLERVCACSLSSWLVNFQQFFFIEMIKSNVFSSHSGQSLAGHNIIQQLENIENLQKILAVRSGPDFPE